MTAIVEQIGWTAYCDDCNWGSDPYDYESAADYAADTHNYQHHGLLG